MVAKVNLTHILVINQEYGVRSPWSPRVAGAYYSDRSRWTLRERHVAIVRPLPSAGACGKLDACTADRLCLLELGKDSAFALYEAGRSGLARIAAC